MTAEDIFAYISSETGWIWTTLGWGMRDGEEWSHKIFGEIAPSKEQSTIHVLSFMSVTKYHASFWSVPLYRFPRNLARTCESLSAWTVYCAIHYFTYTHTYIHRCTWPTTSRDPKSSMFAVAISNIIVVLNTKLFRFSPTTAVGFGLHCSF